MVKDFTELSVAEQIKLAKSLIEKIDSEKIFTDETNFEFQDVDLDNTSKGLCISISTSNPIRISREASWEAGTEEGATEDPGNNAEFEYSLLADAKKSFKTLSCEIDGYTVSLQIDDIEKDETSDSEVEVVNLTHEDAGIGPYEFWGFKGYDSQPYVAAEGVITSNYDCNLTIFVDL